MIWIILADNSVPVSKLSLIDLLLIKPCKKPPANKSMPKFKVMVWVDYSVTETYFKTVEAENEAAVFDMISISLKIIMLSFKMPVIVWSKYPYFRDALTNDENSALIFLHMFWFNVYHSSNSLPSICWFTV